MGEDDKHSGTNRQPHLSPRSLSPSPNIALLTASFLCLPFLDLSHLFFHPPPPPLTVTWLHSAIQKHAAVHARGSLHSYYIAPASRGRFSQTLPLPPRGFAVTVCFHSISFANHFYRREGFFFPLCLVIREPALC